MNFGRYLIKFIFTAFYYHDIMVMSRVGFIFALSIFRWFMISKKSYCFYTENFRNAFQFLQKKIMSLFCQGINKLILYVTKINPIFKNIRSIYLSRGLIHFVLDRKFMIFWFHEKEVLKTCPIFKRIRYLDAQICSTLYFDRKFMMF